MHSYGIKWDSRLFYASVHHEIHNDLFGGSNNVSTSIANLTAGSPTPGAHSRDTGTRIRLFNPDGTLDGDTRAMGLRNVQLIDPTTQDWQQQAARFLDAMIDTVTICGPKEHVRERLAAFREAGVDTLGVSPMAWTKDARLEQLRLVADLM